MRQVHSVLVFATLGALALGCDDKKSSDGTASTAQQTAPAQPATQAGKGEGHDHDDGGAHTGERHDLGKKEVGGSTVQVTQIADVKGGGEATFEIVVSGPAKPQAVRAWLGTEAGDGSVKVKAVERGKFFDADIEVPEKLPQESKLWVEVESGEKKAKVPFDTESH